MKPISIKFKWILLLIFVVVFPLFAGTSLWMDATAKKVREMYPIEKSKNSAASAEFLKALEYRIYIDELHPTMDYDNPIILKLIEHMDDHFQKGKKLLPKESVEDIVWWVLIYKEIYGLVVPPRNDNSLAYENLNCQEFSKKHDEIFQMIKRYPEGEVYFDLPEIRGFQFQAMAILVEYYNAKYMKRFNKNNTLKQNLDFLYNDQKNNHYDEHLKEILASYEIIKNKYLNQSKFLAEMRLHYYTDAVHMSLELIKKEMYNQQNHQLSPIICQSQEAIFTQKHITFILDSLNMDNYQTKMIYKNLFDKSMSDNPNILIHMALQCPNLNPSMREVAKQIILLNKNKKDKK